MRKSDQILYIIIIFSLLLRIAGLLTQKSLNFDESVVWDVSSFAWLDILNGLYNQFRFHPPLYYLFVKLWGMASQSEIWLRFPSVIASSITTYAIFHVARKLTDIKTAYFSAFLFATSTFHILWSNQMRVYPILFLVGLLTIKSYLKVMELPKAKSWIWFITLCFLSFALDYSFIWLFISFIIHSVILLIFRFISKKSTSERSQLYQWLLAAFGITFTGYFTIGRRVLPAIIKGKEALTVWINIPVVNDIFTLIPQFLITDVNFEYPDTAFTIYSILLILIFIYLAFGSILIIKKKIFLPIIIFILPILISFLVSQYIPIFINRNLYLLSFAVIIIISYILRFKSFALVFIFFWIIVNSGIYIQWLKSQPTENWTQLSSLLKANNMGNYIIFPLPEDFQVPLLYYDNKYKILKDFPSQVMSGPIEMQLAVSIRYLHDHKPHCLIIRQSDGRIAQYEAQIRQLPYPFRKEISGISLYCLNK